MSEFLLHDSPCVVCGHPALSLIPNVGVRHRDSICFITAVEAVTHPRGTRRSSKRRASQQRRAKWRV